MSLYKELSYDGGDIDTIIGVQFCIMSPDDIRSRSALEVTKETYSHNEPVHSGLFDRRMGVVEPNVLCQTCEQKNTFCPGHFGHIELAKPVFHVHFFDMVKKLLKCICFRCSKVPIIVEESDEVKLIKQKRLSRQKRWDLMYKLLQKVKKCPHCGMRQPDRSTKHGILRIELEWKSANHESSDIVNNKVVLSAEDVLRMFRRMTDDDINLLGFCKTNNRPEWMICTVLLVPPPAVRPTVKNEVGQRQEDDLTTKLISIVKHNLTVKAKLEKGLLDQADQYAKLLQWEVATLIDNNIQGIPPSQVMRTGRPMRALTERLKSKEGRIRGNLMGKRVDFSARSVITPDPNISIDELGVPRRIAMNLTMPEIVNRFSKTRLSKMVANGPERYPGAKLLTKVSETSRKIRLKSLNDEELLQASQELVDGDIVERHILDGDVVLFNRQPSLHKMSMMGHRVRVMDFNTFRLNVCVTPNFNADFDGDEMNMHVPQSLQTHEELRELATVMNQIISPRECKPIISVVQDIALGVLRMTRKGSSVSERHLMNMLSSRDNIVPAVRNGERIYGHALLSTAIPKGLYTKSHGVTVRDGEIMSGSETVSKKVYQEQSNGLVHAIHNSLGKEATRQFFDDTQKLVCDFLVLDGFSVGISDLVASGKAREGFKDVFKKLKQQVQDVVKSVHEGNLENTSTKSFREFFENQVINLLSEARNKISNLAISEVGDKDNRLLSMINNSKGTDINVAQMVGCVGQVNVDGNKRIPFGFESRTLPHYNRFDDGPEARGFVRNSFIGGLTPQEFFFHSMGGREGLIDTAVKTSETGYIQRKLVKAMEDFKIHHDGTVRNAAGTIIQFLYGEDGMDPIRVERQKLTHITASPPEVQAQFMFDDEELLSYGYSEKDLLDVHETMRSYLEVVFGDREFVILEMFGGKVEEIEFPVNIARMLSAFDSTKSKSWKASEKDPVTDIIDAVDKLYKTLKVNRANSCPKIFGVILRALLAPKAVMKALPSMDAFEKVLDKIRTDFDESVADASEMVGVVAAQSISEPTTQLTLNTFHLSGVASASTQVRGVPRLKEIIDCTASKNIKTPVMNICFDEGIRCNKIASIDMMHRLQMIRFKDIVSRSRIYFDPAETIGAPSHIEQDTLFIELYSRFDALSSARVDFSPWVLRLEFDRQRMHSFSLTMADVDRVLGEFYDDRISCVFSDDNANEMAMRVRLMLTDSKGQDDDLLTELKALEHNILENVKIRGVESIEKVVIRETLQQQRYNKETRYFEPFSEYVVETDGSNMLGVMGIPGVDWKRTMTNDIYEVFHTLGVEAARQKLHDEIIEVLSTTYINYRHVALLVDAITNKGTLVSVNRHGINQGDNGPLAKCSFEETVVRLVSAGIFSEKDKVNGVSANIMLGQVAPCGTGDSKILIDVSKLPDAMEVIEEEAQDGDALADDPFEFDLKI